VKHYIKNKRIIIILLILTILILSFRFTPYLIPINEDDIKKDSYHSVKFFDRNDNLLQEVLSKNEMRSVHCDISQVSSYFLDAIIAAEDKNFYQHNGIDYPAVFRACWQNLRSRRIVSGASTITLQLARLLHPAERSIWNKLKEAYIAFRLEAGMEKTSILEAYINRLPMGGNLYGIESASRTYLGIPSRDLTLAQATFLAAIPNSPNRLNPYYNLSEIKHRQKMVLNRMVSQGLITTRRAAGVLKEEINIKTSNIYFVAPHYIFQLMESLPENAYTVKTTVDLEIQKMVMEQVKTTLAHLKEYHVTNAAVLLLDNQTGEVLAYAGSADFFDTRHDGQYDGVRALRQPGSTLKPFLYLLAMENGFTPASLISDIPSHYPMPTGVYSPKNYSEDFHGPIRLREALANSLNVPAVRTLAKIGVESFLKRLGEYQFTSLDEKTDYYGVGLVLGGGEVSLFELVRAYMCLARRGSFQPICEILKINDKQIVTASSRKNISTPQYNFMIIDILSDRFARTSEFGFHSILNLPFPCAAKTGTSFRFCDNWTIGFTRDYTLGVWVGNFDHTPMMKVSGVTGAGPLFAKIMLQLYSQKEYPVKYDIPPGIQKVPICPLSGKKPNEFCPNRIEEYITTADLVNYQKHSCDMHLEENNLVLSSVPVKYADWADEIGIDTKKNHDISSIFKIIHPKDGAIYQRLPNLAPGYQSIRIQLECSEQQEVVDWYLNNEYIKTTRLDHRFLWPAQPGSFELKAVGKNVDSMASLVKFEVE
jgi:penicillin-binding protein 1C